MMWKDQPDEVRVVGVDGMGGGAALMAVGVDGMGGDAALMATDAAEEEGATKLVAVESMVAMEQNLDLMPA
jgi:hypothetical protein